MTTAAPPTLKTVADESAQARKRAEVLQARDLELSREYANAQQAEAKAKGEYDALSAKAAFGEKVNLEPAEAAIDAARKRQAQINQQRPHILAAVQTLNDELAELNRQHDELMAEQVRERMANHEDAANQTAKVYESQFAAVQDDENELHRLTGNRPGHCQAAREELNNSAFLWTPDGRLRMPTIGKRRYA